MGFSISYDGDGDVHPFVDTCFEEEGDIIDCNGVRIAFGGFRGEPPLFAGNAGMDDAFQLFEFYGITKYDVAERVAINRAIWIQHTISECLDDLPPGRLAGYHNLTGQNVGVYHDGTAPFEHRGHRTLPGCNAACQSDQNHGNGAYRRACRRSRRRWSLLNLNFSLSLERAGFFD